MAFPQHATRFCPSEVPNELREDFLEAAAVLNTSAKASAALSRRCLQHLLRTYAHTKEKDLAKQIDEVLASGSLPTYLSKQVDSIRNIGNFAAHPIKSTSSGEIVPVEPQESEWGLDVLSDLFDFYFVKPDLAAKREAALNLKLTDAHKPPMKS